MDYLKLAREARARADAANLGPWERSAAGFVVADIGSVDMLKIADCTYRRDTDFVVAARTDVPALCDAIEAQAAEIERLQHRYALLNNDLGETAEVCGRQAAEIERLKAASKPNTSDAQAALEWNQRVKLMKAEDRG